MTDGGHGEDPLSPAEARVVRLLLLLRTEPPDRPGLSRSVMQTVQWQLVVRGLARAVGDIAVVAAQGIGMLFGRDRRRG